MEQEDSLPGGDAMLELLTRLIDYQTTLTSQLEVDTSLPLPL